MLLRDARGSAACRGANALSHALRFLPEWWWWWVDCMLASTCCVYQGAWLLLAVNEENVNGVKSPAGAARGEARGDATASGSPALMLLLLPLPSCWPAPLFEM